MIARGGTQALPLSPHNPPRAIQPRAHARPLVTSFPSGGGAVCCGGLYLVPWGAVLSAVGGCT